MENYRTQTGYYQDAAGNWIQGNAALSQAGNVMRMLPYAGGPAVGSFPGGGAGGYGGGPTAADDAKLEEQRRLALASLNQGANYYASPFGQQIQGAIGARAAGADAPYTQAVQDRLFSRQADLAASAEQSDQARIRSMMGERGMEGSGAALAAMLGAGRQRSAANSAALSDIENRAQLENFGARVQGQQQGADWLAQRSAAEAPYRLKETDFRGRMEVTGEGGLGDLAKMLGAAWDTSSRALGGNGSPQAGQPFGPQVGYPKGGSAGGAAPAGGGSTNPFNAQPWVQKIQQVQKGGVPVGGAVGGVPQAPGMSSGAWVPMKQGTNVTGGFGTMGQKPLIGGAGQPNTGNVSAPLFTGLGFGGGSLLPIRF